MLKLLVIATGGAIGTLCRYGLSTAAGQFSTSLPLGTIAVNLLGSFCFGLLYAVTEGRAGPGATLRPFFLTGFMGAFTTFSTFIFESQVQLQQKEWALAGANLLGQTVIGMMALMAGLYLGGLINRT